MTGDFVLDELRGRAPDRMAASFARRRFRLHAMLTTAGCDRVSDPAYDHEGSRRGSFVLLQHTLAGRGRLRFEGREQVVGPGQTMLLRFPHDNRYWVASGESWEFFWICLSGREAQRVWRDAMAGGPVVRLPDAVVRQLAATCHDALISGFETPARASSVAYAVAMLLVDAVVHGSDKAVEAPTGIERAVALCDADAVGDHRVDVARLAEAAGFSRHHFSRRFAAERGMPPGRYLATRRMDEAVRLLRSTELTVREVARACGFADPNHFAKAFRRWHGQSPLAFRGAGRK